MACCINPCIYQAKPFSLLVIQAFRMHLQLSVQYLCLEVYDHKLLVL
jgi:hypothetical protein